MAMLGTMVNPLGGGDIISPGGASDVSGPGSSTDNAVVRWDGTAGDLVQNSVIIMADTTGAMSGWATGTGLTFHGGGTLTGASGALTLTASGTNQNVTLTPSGTGQVIFPVGAAGTPSLGFTGDTTTGFYSLTSGEIGYAGNGTQRFKFTYGADNGGRIVQPTSGSYMGFTATGTGTIIFGPSGTLALTLGSDQSATFASTISAVTTSTLTRSAIAATSTDGSIVTNATAATGAATVQMSPRVRLHGAAWDTAASQTLDWIVENLPTSAATPSSTLKFGHSLNGAAYTYPMTLTSAGALTTVSSITSGAQYLGAAGSASVPLYSCSSAATSGMYFATNQVLISTNSGLSLAISGNTSPFVAFGGETSSFPAIKRSSATLAFRLADDSADAAITAGAGTFSGNIVHGGTITGPAGNTTIIAGTGNSRTMALQTTTSGGTATTFLSANATQDVTLAATLLLPAGTVSAPSYSFTADTNTGIYNSTADNLDFTTGGVKTFTLSGGATATLTGGAGNMTVIAGTGNSRTLTLQTTTSGGTATTFLSGDASQNTTISKLISSYNAVATTGWGLPAIYATGRVTAQTAQSAAIATYTVGASDGSFDVSGNVNVTASTTHSFSLDVTYTDETNTSRTLILPLAQLAGSFVTGGLVTNATGTGPYESPVMHIRCKAATSITIRPSAGTFTSVTYNAEADIRQTA